MRPLDVLVLLFVGALALVFVASALFRRRERRIERRVPCRFCGYSMLGAASTKCPECGNQFDPSDSRPYVGRPRAWIRSVAIVLMALASTFVAATSTLPTYRVFSASVEWRIQSVVGDHSANVMRILGRSSEYGEWSLEQGGQSGGAVGGDPVELPPGVHVDLEEIDFLWRGKTLTLFRDDESAQWIDDSSAVYNSDAILGRLNAPETFDGFVDALLTKGWFDGELNAYYQSVAYHKPGEYGPGTENRFQRKRQPFHFTGLHWSWDAATFGLYVTWTLIWIVAVLLIGLCFWVDRRKPSRRKPDATLPA